VQFQTITLGFIQFAVNVPLAPQACHDRTRGPYGGTASSPPGNVTVAVVAVTVVGETRFLLAGYFTALSVVRLHSPEWNDTGTGKDSEGTSTGLIDVL
jgi:hypothetical protein